MKTQVSFSIDLETLEAVNKIAKKMQKSRSETLNMLMKFAVKTFGNGRIREAEDPTTNQLLAMMRDMSERFQKRFQDIERRLEASE